MLSSIGNTPIIQLNSESKHQLFAKLETFNPTASIKDRVAKYILEDLLKNKQLQKGQAIVEASSGNMGTSLAAIGGLLNYPVYITCPSKTGILKRKMMESFGAELVICKNTSDHSDQDFYVNKAKQISLNLNGVLINQYDNKLNTQCHYETTGQEIVDFFLQKQISIDYFITVGGSGGTITG